MAGYLYLHGGMPRPPPTATDCRPALAGDRFRPNGEPPDAGSAGRLLTGFGLLRRQLVRGSHQTAAVPGDVRPEGRSHERLEPCAGRSVTSGPGIQVVSVARQVQRVAQRRVAQVLNRRADGTTTSTEVSRMSCSTEETIPRYISCWFFSYRPKSRCCELRA